MNRTVVVYRSKYGTTKQYDHMDRPRYGGGPDGPEDHSYGRSVRLRAIVFCGGLYAGGILGFPLLKKHDDLLKEKRLIVVAVGATLKGEDAKEEIRKRISPPTCGRAAILLRGGLNYKKMGFVDRFVMGLLVRNIKATPPRSATNESKGILATYGKSVKFYGQKDDYPPLWQPSRDRLPQGIILCRKHAFACFAKACGGFLVQTAAPFVRYLRGILTRQHARSLRLLSRTAGARCQN